MKPTIKQERVIKKIWGPDDDYLVVEPQVDECEVKDGEKVVVVILPTLPDADLVDTKYKLSRCDKCKSVIGVIDSKARIDYDSLSSRPSILCRNCAKKRRKTI
jgi:hypothetical protein